jgi:hypothetical protein
MADGGPKEGRKKPTNQAALRIYCHLRALAAHNDDGRAGISMNEVADTRLPTSNDYQTGIDARGFRDLAERVGRGHQAL